MGDFVKVCTLCKNTKLLNEFHRDKNTRDGRATRCAECKCRISAEWRVDNPERNKVAMAKWHKNNREQQNEWTRNRRQTHPEVFREIENRRKARDPYRRHHLTMAQYDDLLLSQNGVCAICLRTPEDIGRRLFIDHDHGCCSYNDHSCGKCVRGLLCGRCNSGLFFVENEDIRNAMVKYLAKDV